MLRDFVYKKPIFILRPDLIGLLLFSLMLSPGIILGFYSLISGGEFIYSFILIFGTLIIWCLIGTLKTKIYIDRIEQKIFWITKWSVSFTEITIKKGLGGDFPLLPSFLIIRKNSNKKIGELINSQYKKSDINKFIIVLRDLNVEIL